MFLKKVKSHQLHSFSLQNHKEENDLNLNEIKEILSVTQTTIQLISRQSTKYKFIIRLNEICQLVLKFQGQSKQSTQHLDDIILELKVLKEFIQDTPTISSLINRLISQINKLLVSCRDRFLKNQKINKQSRPKSQYKLQILDRTNTFSEQKEKFYTQFMEHSAIQSPKSQANTLYQELIKNHIQPDKWTYYIQKQLNQR
ncbi:hypothetical protein pb186bvf_018717 [Paramecium bursaria]